MSKNSRTFQGLLKASPTVFKDLKLMTNSVNNILFKYKVHRDTTDTSYIQYNTFERDTEISLSLV